MQSRYKQKHRICSSHFRVSMFAVSRDFFTPSISTGFENKSCAIADVQKLLLFEGFELMVLLIKISMILGPLTNEKIIF